MEFFANIKNGALTNVIPLADGRYFVTIKKKNNRSLPQNAYYHGCIVPEIKRGMYEIGYDEISTNEVHEFLKAKFLQKETVNKNTGEVLLVPGSTASLTTIEFNEFIEKCQKFAAEYLGIVIADPGQQSVIFAEYDNNLKATIVHGSK